MLLGINDCVVMALIGSSSTAEKSSVLEIASLFEGDRIGVRGNSRHLAKVTLDTAGVQKWQRPSSQYS